MAAQNAAHGCDCGKIKVTLLNKRNAAEALTAPLNSEFLKAVDGRKADKVWKLIDELVEAVKILHPRMYTTFIDKVQDL